MIRLKTEKEKMISGEKNNPANPRLVLERARANRICTKYNKRSFNEINMKSRLMRKLINTNGKFWIKSPFFCDYGYNIFIEKNVMLNYGCVILDVCPVKIGEHTLIGPNTHIYTACHSLVSDERILDIEFGKPVTIGKNVWIGGNCTILPGVTIGDNSVIGPGSVVTKDIPNNSIAVGNPAKVKSKNE